MALFLEITNLLLLVVSIQLLLQPALMAQRGLKELCLKANGNHLHLEMGPMLQ